MSFYWGFGRVFELFCRYLEGFSMTALFLGLGRVVEVFFWVGRVFMVFVGLRGCFS